MNEMIDEAVAHQAVPIGSERNDTPFSSELGPT